MWGEGVEEVDCGGGEILVQDAGGGDGLLEEGEEGDEVGGGGELGLLLAQDVFDGIEDDGNLCCVRVKVRNWRARLGGAPAAGS